MYALDFFNTSPQYSIFQKETNETTFGGIIFLLFLIGMFILSLAYILDYAVNDKYEIEVYEINAFNPVSTFKFEQITDPNVNPEIDFTIDLSLDYSVNSEFSNVNINEIINNLYLLHNKTFYKGKFCSNNDCPSNADFSYIIFDIRKKIADGNDLSIYFKCNDSICSNYPQQFFRYVEIRTKNYEIKHEEPNALKITDCLAHNPPGFEDFDNNACTSYTGGSLEDNQAVRISTKLAPIVYEEKKGISRLFDYISGKDKKSYFAYIEKDTTKVEVGYHKFLVNLDKNGKIVYDDEEEEYYDDEEEEYYDDEDEEYYDSEDEEYYDSEDEEYYDGEGEDYYYGKEKENKSFILKNEEYSTYAHLAIIDTFPIHKYQKYRRSEISFLDVLSNIGALFSTFNTVLTVVFRFYSKNYDHYEIVDKILKTELRKDTRKKKINLNNIHNEKKLMEMSDVNPEPENDKLDSPLITENNEKIPEVKISDEFEGKQGEEEDFYENKNESDEENILPKLSFIEFFLNNLYFKKCKRRNQQEILELCNKIILKYISIDSVLYNLMKLENLFKDYRWNNPRLKNLNNNELILALKKFI